MSTVIDEKQQEREKQIEGLRASKARFVVQSKTDGTEMGEAWALSLGCDSDDDTGSYSFLFRLANRDTSNEDDLNGCDLAAHIANIVTGGRATGEREVQEFWEIATGCDNDPTIYDTDFLRTFVESAVRVFNEI